MLKLADGAVIINGAVIIMLLKFAAVAVIIMLLTFTGGAVSTMMLKFTDAAVIINGSIIIMLLTLTFTGGAVSTMLLKQRSLVRKQDDLSNDCGLCGLSVAQTSPRRE